MDKAQRELESVKHNQDLVEIPRRAMRERAGELRPAELPKHKPHKPHFVGGFGSSATS
jgi:hypothetical protein